jgi:hypothetical protein
VITWTCSHCGVRHGPSDIRRLDNDYLQCQQRKRAFLFRPVITRNIGPASKFLSGKL